MGKILTYLKISEDNQSRDVLDAERLLEGMQAIYATSPSGSKKDNFAIPLAEMTKIFIEKVKSIPTKEEPKEEPQEEPNQEQDDTFKLGDMFYITKEGKEKAYQVIYIDGQNFTFVRGNDGNIEAYEGLYTTDEANLKLKEGRWTKISDEKEFPKEEPKDDIEFKVGDVYSLLVPSGQTTLTIKNVNSDRIKVQYADGTNGMFDLTTAKLRVKNKGWKKIQSQKSEDEFKIGDKYLNKTIKDTFTIIQVYTDFIDVKFSSGIEATYDMMLCKEKVADGTWVKVVDEEKEEPKDQDFPYKVDDNFYVPSVDEYFKITELGDVTVMFTYINDGRLFTLTKKDFLDRVNTEKTFVPVSKNYKVGDKFLWAKEDITFVIDFIKNGELGIIYSDGLTGFISTRLFEKGLSTGYYKPYTEEAKPEEKKTRKPRQPRTKSEQDKKIEHILDINLDEIQF